MTARRGPLQEHNLGQQEPLSVHSDKLFHRHHWEMDLADVNKEGIRGFVDVCGLRGWCENGEAEETIHPPYHTLHYKTLTSPFTGKNFT
ncbi:hypothetical protein Pmani_019273 [Petrolisthes manimaculis]|uniref:Uncharacterized protein n=1 Tax=Petrolisthes manimaculis TaxID=1843537 RepID=A0AAE1PIR8_9EUCA|nr:hypothetical protein Pmani_019273 [Petrolisthes manimaculis]